MRVPSLAPQQRLCIVCLPMLPSAASACTTKTDSYRPLIEYVTRVGRNHIYTVYTRYFSQGKSPNIQSYTVHIYGFGQPFISLTTDQARDNERDEAPSCSFLVYVNSQNRGALQRRVAFFIAKITAHARTHPQHNDIMMVVAFHITREDGWLY